MIGPLLHKLGRRFGPKAFVLMYHRVDDVATDPWQLAVSPAHFDQQLRVLRQHWHPVSLTELHRAVATRSVVNRSVVLTFDDGYIDNFEQAKPLLEKYDIPATFFIPTQNCERQALFWWDELQQLILDTEVLPQTLTLSIGDELLHHDLADEALLTPEHRERQRSWIAFEDEPVGRCALYQTLWSKLRPLPDPDQQRILTELHAWAGGGQQPPSLVCMTPEHIRQLIRNPLFSVGAHTVTHPALADHAPAEQEAEISRSKAYLEQLTGKTIQLFAYPYGSFTEATVSIVDGQAFTAAVTTHEGAITRFSQPLRLNRYQVNNWRGDELQTQLTNWLRNP